MEIENPFTTTRKPKKPMKKRLRWKNRGFDWSLFFVFSRWWKDLNGALRKITAGGKLNE